MDRSQLNANMLTRLFFLLFVDLDEDANKGGSKFVYDFDDALAEAEDYLDNVMSSNQRVLAIGKWQPGNTVDHESLSVEATDKKLTTDADSFYAINSSMFEQIYDLPGDDFNGFWDRSDELSPSRNKEGISRPEALGFKCRFAYCDYLEDNQINTTYACIFIVVEDIETGITFGTSALFTDGANINFDSFTFAIVEKERSDELMHDIASRAYRKAYQHGEIDTFASVFEAFEQYSGKPASALLKHNPVPPLFTGMMSQGMRHETYDNLKLSDNPCLVSLDTHIEDSNALSVRIDYVFDITEDEESANRRYLQKSVSFPSDFHRIRRVQTHWENIIDGDTVTPVDDFESHKAALNNSSDTLVRVSRMEHEFQPRAALHARRAFHEYGALQTHYVRDDMQNNPQFNKVKVD